MKSINFIRVALLVVMAFMGVTSLSAQSVCMSKAQALIVIQSEMTALSGSNVKQPGASSSKIDGVGVGSNSPAERQLKLDFIKQVMLEIRNGNAATTWAAVQSADTYFQDSINPNGRLTPSVYANVYASVLTLLQCN